MHLEGTLNASASTARPTGWLDRMIRRTCQMMIAVSASAPSVSLMIFSTLVPPPRGRRKYRARTSTRPWQRCVLLRRPPTVFALARRDRQSAQLLFRRQTWRSRFSLGPRVRLSSWQSASGVDRLRTSRIRRSLRPSW